MLVVAGETIVDMIETTPRKFEAFTGGAPYNVAKAAAKLGAKTGYLSPLSQDSFGDDFVAEMAQFGVEALSPRSPQPSGLAIVQKDENGHPSYAFYRDHAADRDISLEALQAAMPKAQLFSIGGLAIAGGADAAIWQEFIAWLDCPVFLDPNIRPSFIQDRADYLARLEAIYKKTDILKLSDEDIAWLAPYESAEGYFKSVLEKNEISIGFLTKGADGAHAYTARDTLFLNAPKISVVDTVGAGDCFSASALSKLLERQDVLTISKTELESVLDFAMTAAAINCTRAGANPPTRAEIAAFQK